VSLIVACLRAWSLREGVLIRVCGVQVALAVSRYAEGYSRASLLFKMFCDVWYFRNLSPSRVSRLFTACIEETRQPGDVIVRYLYLLARSSVRTLNPFSIQPNTSHHTATHHREGEVTSRFYLIVAGVLDVYQEEVLPPSWSPQRTRCIGDCSMLTRNARVQLGRATAPRALPGQGPVLWRVSLGRRQPSQAHSYGRRAHRHHAAGAPQLHVRAAVCVWPLGESQQLMIYDYASCRV
jgi:hypothetical protein